MSTLPAGFGLGLFLAAQVGPVTLLIVRTVLRGRQGVAVGLAMATAVALVDLLYAMLGLAGAGQLLDSARFRVPLGLLSAAILVGIGARTLWRGFHARLGIEADADVATPPRAFGTALAATAFNPLTIGLWTVSFPAAAPESALHSVGRAAPLLLGVGLGTLLWHCGFSLVVAVARRRIGERLLGAVDVAVGSGLVVFGGLVGLRAVREP
jgi:threonine/homoserine/homoserine lactone efflux protein